MLLLFALPVPPIQCRVITVSSASAAFQSHELPSWPSVWRLHRRLDILLLLLLLGADVPPSQDLSPPLRVKALSTDDSLICTSHLLLQTLSMLH